MLGYKRERCGGWFRSEMEWVGILLLYTWEWCIIPRDKRTDLVVLHSYGVSGWLGMEK
jgi:hypothetical protein